MVSIHALRVLLTLVVIPATPREVRIKLMDSHSALVTWSSPKQQLVTSFYVEYKVKNSKQVQLKIVQNQLKTSLTSLQSHAEYEVRVRAVNGAGGGIWSKYVTFSTGETCKRRKRQCLAIPVFNRVVKEICRKKYFANFNPKVDWSKFVSLIALVHPQRIQRARMFFFSGKTYDASKIDVGLRING